MTRPPKARGLSFLELLQVHPPPWVVFTYRDEQGREVAEVLPAGRPGTVLADLTPEQAFEVARAGNAFHMDQAMRVLRQATDDLVTFADILHRMMEAAKVEEKP